MNFKKINSIINLVILTFLVIMQTGCLVNNEKVAQQLDEIQLDIKSLKLESSQLRTAITEIHRSTVVGSAQKVAVVPQAIIAEVKIDEGRAILGKKTAKIGIIEFSDYQCPFCSRFYKQTLGKIKQKYLDTGKAVFMYRDYPLGFHSEAKGAAIAANCAGKQNKYWEMHNQLFENNRNLNSELYLSIAEDLKMDQQKFTRCLNSNIEMKKVEDDFAYGQSLGVSGTPSFFIGKLDGNKIINAKKLTGAQPYSAFSRIIDSIQRELE